MNDHPLAPLGHRLLAIASAYGLDEFVGGAEKLEEGVRDLLLGLAQVALDGLRAEHDGVGFGDAVFDTVRYPHLAGLHGLFVDLVQHRVPGVILGWAERVVQMGPASDSPQLRRALVALALASDQPMWRLLARFALFEIACVNQRLVLHATGVRLEALGGRGTDVEILAERSVDLALVVDESVPDILDCDDPVEVLVAGALEGLGQHVDLLRHELASVQEEVRSEISRRKELLEIFDGLPVEDAVLAYNGVGLEGPGEERLAIDDLRRRHPLVLGEVSNEAAYKRIERIPEKAHRLRVERVRLRKDTSLADLILRAASKGGAR